MTSSEDPIAADAYDELADEYAETVRSNPYNAHLEFPATTGLIPDVDGKRVLDAGCGTGVYAEWLLERGADVVGVDVSEEMLSHARDRVGKDATFHQHDLAEPLGFADDDEFAGIVSALALGYVRDWRGTFAEFARVLEPGGFLVFSEKNPVDAFEEESGMDYFAVEEQVKEWSVAVPCYRRPFEDICNPLLENEFKIERILEPQPTEDFADTWPERYEKEATHPVFVCVKARTATSGDVAEP